MTITKIEILQCNAIGKVVGMSNPMARHGDDIVARAREMHASGMGYKPIGKALGVAWPTVQSWIGKSGNPRRNVVPVRIKARRQKAKKTG